MKYGGIIMDKKPSDDFGIHEYGILCPDSFGVELELEGRGLTSKDPLISKYFGVHKDNSLRTIREDSECLEYVFNRPYDYQDTLLAVKQLFKWLNSHQSEVFESYRTSFHVHVNYAVDTWRTIYNAITLSIIFDELFVSQNGKHRAGNNFCLRAKDAQALVLDLAFHLENYGAIFNFPADHRYSSVNFASLMKFGTIEYRSLECSVDYLRVKHWIDTCQNLKVYARKFNDPRDIITKFREGPVVFMQEALDTCAFYYMQVPGWDVMLRDGVRLAADFAYCCDWSHEKSSGPKAKPVVNPGVTIGKIKPKSNADWFWDDAALDWKMIPKPTAEPLYKPTTLAGFTDEFYAAPVKKPQKSKYVEAAEQIEMLEAKSAEFGHPKPTPPGPNSKPKDWANYYEEKKQWYAKLYSANATHTVPNKLNQYNQIDVELAKKAQLAQEQWWANHNATTSVPVHPADTPDPSIHTNDEGEL